VIRKKDESWMTKFLKVMSIVVFLNEVIYVSWEIYECHIHGHSFNYDSSLSLYTCSLFIYCLIPAAWAKGKAKEICLAFITTIGLLAGVTGIFTVNGFKYFPIFTYGALYSYFFHYTMTFVALSILISGYYKVSLKSALLSFIPIAILSVIVIPVDYVLKADYMLLYSGDGAPLMPTIANALASHGLRGIYTAIMLLFYIPLSLLMVGIILGIKALIGLITKRRKEERFETQLQE
nr:YwaF family protein [Gammaproteobacteria bacterium]